MAVNPNIKKKADDIRNKVYGREVRESLASGLEEMSSDVVENEGRQSVVEGRQDSVESQWQAVSDEMTDKDVISAPEIIAARNGEADLKARLDKEKNDLTTQLAHTVNVVTPNDTVITGAIGDGVTDDTQALKDIITYAESLLSNKEEVTIVFPVGYVFRTTEPIIIPPDINVLMYSPISYDSEFSQTALTVGAPSLHNSGRRLKLFVQRKQRSPWTNENDIGIKVINLYTSKLELVESSRFTIGAQLIGDDRGFGYNQIDISVLMDNKIALDLTNVNNGWINENVFIGGRFQQTSTSMFGMSRYGVRITSQDEQYINNNNNFFIKPSFELHEIGAKNGNSNGEAIPILIEHGHSNEFISVRSEGNSEYVMRVENDSNNNKVDLGFSTGRSMDEQTRFKTNQVTDRRYSILNTGDVIFNSGAVHKKLTQYEDEISFDDMSIFGTASSTPIERLSGFTVEDDGLSFSGTRGIGVRVLTDKVKKFVIKRDVGGNLGRVHIRTMSADGTDISSSETNLVTGRSGMTPTYYNMFGGSYGTNTDSDLDFFIHLSDEVKMIDVIIKGECILKSFSIQSIGGLATAYKI